MTVLPPPPYTTDLVDKKGVISPIWLVWLNQLWQRVGQGNAPTPNENDELIAYGDYTPAAYPYVQSEAELFNNSQRIVVDSGTFGSNDEGALFDTRQASQGTALDSLSQIIESTVAPNPNYLLTRANTWLLTQTFNVPIAGTISDASNVAIINDTTTNATMFPTWVTANTGSLPVKVTSTKLTFNPSTGVLSSTSFTGAGTGLTGTAASLTAGTVTTNANLTGPITSVGNATSIASQTGTGSKFVVDTSPTLVTPNIGVATATSITFGGTALSYYDEGTWTPSDQSGAALSLTVTSALYVRIGRAVYIQAYLSYPVTASALTTSIGGLPFTVVANGFSATPIETNATATGPFATFRAGTTTLFLNAQAPEVNLANSVFSGKYLAFAGFYFI